MSSEDQKKYEFKFLTKDSYTVRKNIPLYIGVDEAQKCLASEGVMITPASFIKCLDIYLRIIGICRAVDENDFPPVCVMTGVIEFKDRSENLKNPKCLEMYQKLFELINECVDDDHKMPESDLKQINDHIDSVMKELCIFFNDIVNLLTQELHDSNTLSVCALVYTKVPPTESEHRFSVEIGYNHDFDSIALSFMSTVLVPMDDNTATGILIDSFPKEVQDRISKMKDTSKEEEINKAMPETKEN